MSRKSIKILPAVFVLVLTLLLSACVGASQEDNALMQADNASETQSSAMPSDTDASECISGSDAEENASSSDKLGEDAVDTSTAASNAQNDVQNNASADTDSQMSSETTVSTSATTAAEGNSDVVEIEPFSLHPNIYEFSVSVGGTVDYSSLVMYMDYVYWKADGSYEEINNVVVTEKCNIPQPDTSLEGRHTVEITCTEYGVLCVARIYVNVGNTGLNYTLSNPTVERGGSVTINVEKPSYLSVFGYHDNGLVTYSSGTGVLVLNIPEDYDSDTVSMTFFFEDYTSYGRVVRKSTAVISVV